MTSAAPGEIAFQPGLLGPGGTFLYSPAGYTFFNSLGVDGAGNVCVATIGQSGISVISPGGELVEFVATDDPFTTNICFGGPDLKHGVDHAVGHRAAGQDGLAARAARS